MELVISIKELKIEFVMKKDMWEYQYTNGVFKAKLNSGFTQTS